MDSGEPTRRTSAILFSDIQGYSKLMDEHESLGLKLLEEHNAICVPLIKKHGGQVIKFIGDAILASFDSASAAVEYGVTVQRLLAERNASLPDIVPLVLRIGIHIGDVVFKDGDVFGEGVNIAARIEPLAEPGGVAISQTVYDMIKARAEIQTVSLGPKELKNIKEAVNIYQVVIDAQGGRARAPSSNLLLYSVLCAAALVVGGLVAGTGLLHRPAASGRLADGIRVETKDAKDPSFENKKRERDDAWFQQLRPVLESTTADAEKTRLAVQYYEKFHADPGVNEGVAADLARWLPAGDARKAMEALAVSPKGVEAATRLRLKRATAQALMRMTRNKAFPSDKARRDFCWQTPIAKTGWLVDLSEGQPAHDAQGRLVYAYRTAGGGKREVPVPAAALGYGPAAESAAAQGGELLAKDYLDAEGVR